jgi:RND superfamily putative drug exporter
MTSSRSLLVRIAAGAQRRRWLALTVWVVILAGVTAGSQAVGSAYRSDVSLPGTESQAVVDVLRQVAPDRAGDSVQIALHHPDGLAEPATRDRIQRMLQDVTGLPHVVQVTDPFTGAGALSADGRTGYANVQLDAASADIPTAAAEALVETARDAGGAGLQVELGGDVVRAVSGSGGGPAEGLGMLAALVILVLMFGSVLAAGLPLITAVFAVGGALGVIALVSNVATVPSYVAPLMMLVGLGVGIDYALLIFSRYRTELLRGADRTAAAERALDTAGRSVLFAGATVMIALLGLLVLGLASLQGVALAVALTVLVTMIASLTLLPALLAIFGRRLERSVRRRQQRRPGPSGGRWRRWSTVVQRRPWPAIVVATVLLGAMAAPALSMRLGIADAGTDPAGDTTRAAYDLLAEGFGPGVNGPLVVVADGTTDPAQAGRRLAGVDGVAAVAPAQRLPGSDIHLLVVVPETGPHDAATEALVADLRDRALPAIERDLGGTYLAGGAPAAAADFAHAVADRLPWFVLAVVGLSALLLMVVFSSIAIPVKAAALNILSIGATLGVITAVFQDGRFGFTSGPIEAFVPVMIFAIVFGLSMDYEVFLVTRMHEEWNRTRDARLAVREGMAHTGAVITAAAAIMIVVFGAFVLSPDRMLQQFGLGLAVAVLVDALIIRCLLVPAIMSLLGHRAWWLPAAVARRMPAVALEAPGDDPARQAEPARMH